jgi:ribonuclease P protein component
MFKKNERLSRSLFTDFFNRGHKNHGLYTTVIKFPHPSFLCSVVVGKKVSKKSPVRNQVRRRIYGIMEEFRKQKNLVGVYIVIAKPAVAKLSKREFRERLIKEVGGVLN